MISHTFNLIPRNNWDYRLEHLCRAIQGNWARSSRVESAALRSFADGEVMLTGSGRASLFAILKGLNLPKNAEVGVPLFCCSVVFEAIHQAGFRPRFLDISERDFNLAATDLEKKRDGLSAILLVHMFGNPADVEAIEVGAGDVPLIEDCAQSLFSSYHGRPTGTLTQASFFSFRSGKYLSAGEGSAICCRDAALAARIKEVVAGFSRSSKMQFFRRHVGTYVKSALYHRPWYGMFSYPLGRFLDKRMNLTAKDGFVAETMPPGTLQVVIDRLPVFRQAIERQRQNAHFVLDQLSVRGVGLPSENPGCLSNWFQFAVRFKSAAERDKVANFLFRRGIDTARYLHDIVDVACARYGYQGDCPTAELCSQTTLLIPIYYTLTQRDLEHIVDSANRATEFL